MRVTWSDIFYLTLAALVVALALTVLVAYHAEASTDERQALDAIEIVDEAAMEELAAVLADADASPACRAYADVLLYLAGALQHALRYPDSYVARTELVGRIMPSVSVSQYACENAV